MDERGFVSFGGFMFFFMCFLVGIVFSIVVVVPILESIGIRFPGTEMSPPDPPSGLDILNPIAYIIFIFSYLTYLLVRMAWYLIIGFILGVIIYMIVAPRMFAPRVGGR